MTRPMLSTVAFATLLALGACSSNDDDAPADVTDDTSALGEDRELSGDPGGDTRAIAGYWNASGTDPEAAPDSRLVLIEDDGLQTSYELQQEDVGGANCYSRIGPQTLTPGAGDGYALDDGTAYTATRSEDGSMLTVTLEPELVETWTLIEGTMPQDLPLCSTSEGDGSPAGGENVLPGEGIEPNPADSSFNPDLDTAPSSDPSGDDTSAIAGLWDATGGPEGRVDRRYVLISDDGSWTDYDLRQDDVADDGNCYAISMFRLDLESGDAADGTYSVADGRVFDLDVAESGDADTLGVTVRNDTGDDVPGTVAPTRWPRVVGFDAIDLEPCSAG